MNEFATRRHPIYKLVYFQCSETYYHNCYQRGRAPKCRMKARNGNIKKRERSFNEQKIQIRIQKCLRLFRLRSSEKYKMKVFNLTSHVLVALSRGKITQATIGANSIRRR